MNAVRVQFKPSKGNETGIVLMNEEDYLALPEPRPPLVGDDASKLTQPASTVTHAPEPSEASKASEAVHAAPPKKGKAGK